MSAVSWCTAAPESCWRTPDCRALDLNNESALRYVFDAWNFHCQIPDRGERCRLIQRLFDRESGPQFLREMIDTYSATGRWPEEFLSELWSALQGKVNWPPFVVLIFRVHRECYIFPFVDLFMSRKLSCSVQERLWFALLDPERRTVSFEERLGGFGDLELSEIAIAFANCQDADLRQRGLDLVFEAVKICENESGFQAALSVLPEFLSTPRLGTYVNQVNGIHECFHFPWANPEKWKIAEDAQVAVRFPMSFLAQIEHPSLCSLFGRIILEDERLIFAKMLIWYGVSGTLNGFAATLLEKMAPHELEALFEEGNQEPRFRGKVQEFLESSHSLCRRAMTNFFSICLYSKHAKEWLDPLSERIWRIAPKKQP